MRTKAVPEPATVAALQSAHQAVPLVPEPTADCCARVQSRGPAQTREAAQEWLAFLEALDLVTETERGYERRHVDIDGEPLATRFRDRVYGVPEVLDALDGQPSTPETVFEATQSIVPTWERNRHPDWETVWLERTEVVLEWATVFELVTKDGNRYELL